jgi:heme/copper-type cytochrome/quinol oxidase subunit 2
MNNLNNFAGFNTACTESQNAEKSIILVVVLILVAISIRAIMKNKSLGWGKFMKGLIILVIVITVIPIMAISMPWCE